MHPNFEFGDKLITRLDYDEYNAVVNLLLSDLSIVQVPLVHRNSHHFIGMGERDFYLCTRKIEQNFFALDKYHYVNKWSIETGKLLQKNFVEKVDYRGYTID